MTLSEVNLVEKRTKKRQEWDKDFNNHHKTFAEKIAVTIATTFIEKFIAPLSNPYAAPLDSTYVFSQEFSFQIYDKHTAIAMKSLNKEATDLPPFKEWLEHFAEIDEPRLDTDYLDDRIQQIVTVVDKKLNAIISDFSAKPAHCQLKIKIIWHATNEASLNRNSRLKSNVVRIEGWLDESKQPEKKGGIDFNGTLKSYTFKS
ncbi:MAG: hypothetical protein LLG04_11165 [Parachlamydia sp.]|nr:hypothetical protein [Parachlamydia sp.]